MIKTKHYIAIFVPAILIVGIALLVQTVRFEPLFPKILDQQSKEVQIPIYPDDPIIGEKKAPITLVVFEDLGCENCKIQDELFTELIQKHPDRVKIVWKGFSVTRIPIDTTEAHKYAYCANKQKKFVAFKDMAFANTANLSPATLSTIAETVELNKAKLQDCLASEQTTKGLERTESLADILNIQSVPAVFMDNKQLTQLSTLFEWESALGL